MARWRPNSTASPPRAEIREQPDFQCQRAYPYRLSGSQTERTGRRGLSRRGYIRLAMNHEGHDMADWFNAQGITYAVLKYRMPNGHHDVPLSDAHQAIRLMREHANEWHIQKVGIMGASAGGHLASTAATTIQPERARIFRSCFIPS